MIIRSAGVCSTIFLTEKALQPKPVTGLNVPDEPIGCARRLTLMDEVRVRDADGDSSASCRK